MKTIFFDVDNQLDFLYPAGSLYVPGAEEILPVLAKLTQFAKAHGIQILSTADAHSEDDLEFKAWPPHCVVGTVGQQKAAVTLAVAQPNVLTSVPGATVAAAGQTTLAQVTFAQITFAQIVIEKQHTDCFTNPNLAGLLAALNADRYVVYGVVSEICVRFAALGLLKTGKRVEVVTDAIRHLSLDAYDAMVAEFKAGGGVMTDSASVTGQ